MAFLIGNAIITLAQCPRLDQNPEVNGLRIGMPYSEISTILEYRQRTDMGADVYAVKDIRTEQQSIEAGLTNKYGPPMYNVSNPNADPALFGVRWRGKSHEATVCTYYYGIDGGFSLTYLLAEIR